MGQKKQTHCTDSLKGLQEQQTPVFLENSKV